MPCHCEPLEGLYLLPSYTHSMAHALLLSSIYLFLCLQRKKERVLVHSFLSCFSKKKRMSSAARMPCTAAAGGLPSYALLWYMHSSSVCPHALGPLGTYILTYIYFFVYKERKREC